jgi:hypothetical protein
MRTTKSRWDVERAAAWLRRHTWGGGGEDSAPALEQTVVAAAQAEADAAADGEEDELDIAGWPALVAPFYD